MGEYLKKIKEKYNFEVWTITQSTRLNDNVVRNDFLPKPKFDILIIDHLNLIK